MLRRPPPPTECKVLWMSRTALYNCNWTHIHTQMCVMGVISAPAGSQRLCDCLHSAPPLNLQWKLIVGGFLPFFFMKFKIQTQSQSVKRSHRGVVRRCVKRWGAVRSGVEWWGALSSCEEMWGAVRNGEEMCGSEKWWRVVRSGEELWGAVRGCEEWWGVVRGCVAVRSSDERWGAVRNCEELWGAVRRCEEWWKLIVIILKSIKAAFKNNFSFVRLWVFNFLIS